MGGLCLCWKSKEGSTNTNPICQRGKCSRRVTEGLEEEGVEGRHLATAGLNYPWRGWGGGVCVRQGDTGAESVCETGGWGGGGAETTGARRGATGQGG